MPRELGPLLRRFIRITHRCRQRERENVLHDKNLVSRDIEILEILFEHHPDSVTFKQIVEEIDLGASKPTNRSTISQAITRLMKDHRLVEKGLDIDGDQRQPIIKLTEPGVKLARALHDIDTSLIPKFIAAMSLDEAKRKEIISGFERGIENFQKLSSIVDMDFEKQKPNVARIYDYLIGGTYHFAVDRLTAEAIITKNPAARDAAVAGRAFLRRSVDYLAREKGIKQFIDIGSGLPTMGNTHEIVQGIHPRAKVVYVDLDAEAVEASRILLKGNKNAGAICADVRDPESILKAPEMKIIDFTSPVAVICVLLLHFVAQDDVAFRSMRSFKEKLVKGSYLIISHGMEPPEVKGGWLTEIMNDYKRNVADVKIRSREEVLKFFDGTELVEPGLVYASEWRPDIPDSYLPREELPFADNPYRSLILAGVGRIR